MVEDVPLTATGRCGPTSARSARRLHAASVPPMQLAGVVELAQVADFVSTPSRVRRRSAPDTAATMASTGQLLAPLAEAPDMELSWYVVSPPYAVTEAALAHLARVLG